MYMFLDLCFPCTRLHFCVLLTAKESFCEIMGGDGAKISGCIIVIASKQIASCHSAVGQDPVMSISPSAKISGSKEDARGPRIPSGKNRSLKCTFAALFVTLAAAVTKMGG